MHAAATPLTRLSVSLCLLPSPPPPLSLSLSLSRAHLDSCRRLLLFWQQSSRRPRNRCAPADPAGTSLVCPSAPRCPELSLSLSVWRFECVTCPGFESNQPETPSVPLAASFGNQTTTLRNTRPASEQPSWQPVVGQLRRGRQLGAHQRQRPWQPARELHWWQVWNRWGRKLIVCDSIRRLVWRSWAKSGRSRRFRGRLSRLVGRLRQFRTIFRLWKWNKQLRRVRGLFRLSSRSVERVRSQLAAAPAGPAG